MTENLKKLFDLLNENEELKKDLQNDPPKTEREFIDVAARHGVVLTEEDLLSAKTELSDKELEEVAGGSGCSDAYYKIECVFSLGLMFGW